MHLNLFRTDCRTSSLVRLPSKLLRKLLLLLCGVLLMVLPVSCYYSYPQQEDHWVVKGNGGVDSVDFYIRHHYWRNFFFEAVDSLQLMQAPAMETTFATTMPILPVPKVGRGDELGVMEVKIDATTQPATVWVKLARDQLCQGWVTEAELLEKAVPDRPVSKFIHHFSDRNLLAVLVCIVVALLSYLIRGACHKQLQIVHFNDIRSFYPTLLCLTVSLGAVLYGTMQRFAPETWVEFYFHPTLNPFDPHLPLVLSAFVASVWLIFIVGVAVLDDLLRLPDFSGSITYLMGLAGVCMMLYLFFTVSVHIYIGYPLLAAYWVFAFRRHFQKSTPHYRCGNCGAPLAHRGKCPECGAFNEF
ncbi:hypothetical protein, membrane [gut metagenome]|uniref:Transmembrane protein n=1 Tax=gut metagenome TaxID=749906 RepID=J9F8Z9_9ZZZZ